MQGQGLPKFSSQRQHIKVAARASSTASLGKAFRLGAHWPLCNHCLTVMRFFTVLTPVLIGLAAVASAQSCSQSCLNFLTNCANTGVSARHCVAEYLSC
ncbi:hypothetical protein GALMADRAFT_1145288 [Galerina marginata CBS 339.88]|uniref:Uncharacterized protein n=1 Tax=Galerina marginata (strain CBS 339.88) TaxID=685588 RepID=A0A067SFQ3_GALM3|nr:hypothetical protein GALMADRAFT_1145288 [Galerina marginata CBS 339.88]